MSYRTSSAAGGSDGRGVILTTLHSSDNPIRAKGAVSGATVVSDVGPSVVDPSSDVAAQQQQGADAPQQCRGRAVSTASARLASARNIRARSSAERDDIKLDANEACAITVQRSLNVLLDDVLLQTEARTIAPRSRLFRRSLFCSLVFMALSVVAALGVFTIFYASEDQVRNEVRNPSFDFIDDHFGGEDKSYSGFSCPCTAPVVKVKNFATFTVRAEPLGPFCQTVARINDMFAGDARGSGLSTNISVPGVVPALYSLCNLMDKVADFDERLLSDGIVNTYLAVDRKSLNSTLDLKASEQDSVFRRSFETLIEIILTKGLVDDNNMLKQVNRALEVALEARACPNCPQLSRPPDVGWFKKANSSDKSAAADISTMCADDSRAQVGTFTFRDLVSGLNCDANPQTMICLILGLFDIEKSTRAFGDNIMYCGGLRTLLNIKFLNLLKFQDSMPAIMNPKSGSGQDTVAALGLAPGDEELAEEMTVFRAIASGKVLTTTRTVSYTQYIAQCKPAQCTYYTKNTWSRLLRALSLTLALVGAVIRVLWRLFVNVGAGCSNPCVKRDSGTTATPRREAGTRRDWSL